MGNVAISIENLSKVYRLGAKNELHDTFVGAMTSLLRSPLQNFRNLRRLTSFDFSKGADDILWALRDVSFQVCHGEVLGIIGRNGAGKSTLLKILSRITEPTTGCVTIHGRVASLLEVGTGFHQDLTGRENVYMNGTILGMRKREIDRKFDEIVEFSGVEKFIDTPIKRYSSGMKVRLAFSVAAHLDPEILIIDEVLAVGDAEFQKKCLGKMEDVSSQGRTVFFVSHSMAAIQRLCQRAILLRQGRCVMDGSTDAVVSEYLSYLSHGIENPFVDNPERTGNGEITFSDAKLLDSFGEPLREVISGTTVTLAFSYTAKQTVDDVNVIFTIINSMGTGVANFNFGLTGFAVASLRGEGTFCCALENLPLTIGQYRVAAVLTSKGVHADVIPNILHFEVIGSQFFPTGRTTDSKYSVCLIAHQWTHVV
jgi:lipopolysaccharide transport system ATP-binding protein